MPLCHSRESESWKGCQLLKHRQSPQSTDSHKTFWKQVIQQWFFINYLGKIVRTSGHQETEGIVGRTIHPLQKPWNHRGCSRRTLLRCPSASPILLLHVGSNCWERVGEGFIWSRGDGLSNQPFSSASGHTASWQECCSLQLPSQRASVVTYSRNHLFTYRKAKMQKHLETVGSWNWWIHRFKLSQFLFQSQGAG